MLPQRRVAAGGETLVPVVIRETGPYLEHDRLKCASCWSASRLVVRSWTSILPMFTFRNVPD